MTGPTELPLVVADNEGTLPKSIAIRLLELAKSAGYETQTALARGMKVTPKTIARAAKGEGSHKFGLQLREFLVDEGVKEAERVSLDPAAPSVVDVLGVDDGPWTADEWIEIGRLLNEYAKPQLAERLPELRRIAAACRQFEQRLKGFK